MGDMDPRRAARALIENRAKKLNLKLAAKLAISERFRLRVSRLESMCKFNQDQVGEDKSDGDHVDPHKYLISA